MSTLQSLSTLRGGGGGTGSRKREGRRNLKGATSEIEGEKERGEGRSGRAGSGRRELADPHTLYYTVGG